MSERARTAVKIHGFNYLSIPIIKIYIKSEHRIKLFTSLSTFVICIQSRANSPHLKANLVIVHLLQNESDKALLKLKIQILTHLVLGSGEGALITFSITPMSVAINKTSTNSPLDIGTCGSTVSLVKRYLKVAFISRGFPIKGETSSSISG